MIDEREENALMPPNLSSEDEEEAEATAAQMANKLSKITEKNESQLSK